jgi:ribosome hibernation promoting factor
MHLIVKGKQLDVGDALRRHIEDSLAAVFDKYFGDAIDATALIAREAHSIRAQLSVHVGRGILLQAQGIAEQPYAACDGAIERIAKRLRRYKRRLRDHHRIDSAGRPAAQYILAGEPDGEDEHDERSLGQPVVIAELATTIPNLTVGEAVMRMDLAELPAMMFQNRAHGGLNVVYRREDGNIGWIDPQGNLEAR